MMFLQRIEKTDLLTPAYAANAGNIATMPKNIDPGNVILDKMYLRTQQFFFRS